MSRTRAYLDWNASAPLRPEARAAMLSAMDEVGNPSSVHAEGRKAKAIVERARAQVADLVGFDASEIVFTSGATEAAALALKGREVACSSIEHDAVLSHQTIDADFPLSNNGVVSFETHGGPCDSFDYETDAFLAIQAANSETGVIQDSARAVANFDAVLFCRIFVDLAQVAGKVSVTHRFLDDVGDDRSGAFKPFYSVVSGHKFGGPKGVGALIASSVYSNEKFVSTAAIRPLQTGGGQEQGRRAGTENVIGIAGFGAAAEAAKRDLEAGVWEGVEAIRNRLEDRLASAAPDLIIFGKEAPRLPNTSCFAVPGWKGETQVMQMDLAGFAVSAGSACSSGKVEKASRVLLAMGFDEITASSAIRVSIGPTTTEAEVMGFADAWEAAYRRWRNKAA